MDSFNIKLLAQITKLFNIFSPQSSNMKIISDGFRIETLLRTLHLIKSFTNFLQLFLKFVKVIFV